METSHFSENKLFAQRVFPILEQARQSHRDYHQGELSLEALQQQRPLVVQGVSLGAIKFKQPKPSPDTSIERASP
jgi:hypothetical protein